MEDYSAMTVNERLFAAGLLEDWDRAVKIGDRRRLTELLQTVDLTKTAPIIIESALKQKSWIPACGSRCTKSRF